MCKGFIWKDNMHRAQMYSLHQVPFLHYLSHTEQRVGFDTWTVTHPSELNDSSWDVGPFGDSERAAVSFRGLTQPLSKRADAMFINKLNHHHVGCWMPKLIFYDTHFCLPEAATLFALTVYLRRPGGADLALISCIFLKNLSWVSLEIHMDTNETYTFKTQVFCRQTWRSVLKEA